MKKTTLIIFLLWLALPTYTVFAEETAKDAAATVSPSEKAPVNAETNTTAATENKQPAAAPVVAAPAQAAAPAETPAVKTEAAEAPAVKTEAAEATNAENLEFISGEVGSVDEAGKKISVKLYGETENTTTQKILTVTLDENTDITDGEKDRALNSLTPGTEVDVEYDPATNKATYIFVY